ncbi:ATPase/histidine kinase/DNA gyrase B/HSP90 domain protein [Ancylostoma caninum]|uniref:ATPase/histidine kinase/DNA gyrase B/HSP90 domain protein n=1 Tax=Ancylostoma caninum TaxID=29170 RepID=A0A368GF55_ANCCA|nr:ATPase/histidine kinase/DNA gyrase B/HSP90 domain protein [Ancylostoma caninum]
MLRATQAFQTVPRGYFAQAPGKQTSLGQTSSSPSNIRPHIRIVVVRPANAVKELIENSLDAGATEITVTIKDGGLSLLQVQDNGKGIQKDDLDIVCERFTTSKLNRFEDLQSMRTYGFRGEALSSISHVAKVTITSKPAGQQCAYQAKYIDGKPESIKASAGLNGTCIAAEDLFYNCPNRKKAFRHHADEANKVTDVVMRYAVHRPDVSFAMRRGGTGADFRTSGRCSRAEIITSLLGKDCGGVSVKSGCEVKVAFTQ